MLLSPLPEQLYNVTLRLAERPRALTGTDRPLAGEGEVVEVKPFTGYAPRGSLFRLAICASDRVAEWLCDVTLQVRRRRFDSGPGLLLGRSLDRPLRF